jgi:epsilon-lactone hydrolase
MSLRAELVRMGVRLLIKRRAGHTDLARERIRLRRYERLISEPPEAIKVEQIDAAGVKADRITMTTSQRVCDILFLHGGGYATGSPAIYRGFGWRLAAATRARLLVPDYRLAPEHPFPAALEDSISVYRWMLANGADPSRLAIIGDSAGGGLAFALLLRLRDERLEDPAAIVALSPWVDLAMTGASMRLNARRDPMISLERIAHSAICYLAGADAREPYASPLYGDFPKAPATLIQVGSDEVLRDDAVRMADKLRAAEGHVELEIWPRMPHVWHLFAPILPEASRAIGRIGEFLDDALVHAPPLRVPIDVNAYSLDHVTTGGNLVSG